MTLARIRIEGMRLRNPLNGARGFSRGAAMAVARERREQRGTTKHRTWAAMRSMMPMHLDGWLDHEGPIAVVLTRISPGELDSDNLAAAFKSVRDGVADAFGVDDRDPRIEWRYAQRKEGRGRYAVEIEIAKREEP